MLLLFFPIARSGAQFDSCGANLGFNGNFVAGTYAFADPNPNGINSLASLQTHVTPQSSDEFAAGRRRHRGGPQFQFNEAISFQIPVETQAEADRYSDFLSVVPEAEQCGWVKDRFGLSWQIVPRLLTKLLADPDPGRGKRAFEAMMTMKRIDIAALERAVDATA